ncbi:hypothetical protein [Pseudobutyrivibrio sp.]
MKNKASRNNEIYNDYNSGMTLSELKKKYDMPIKKLSKIVKRGDRKRDRRLETAQDIEEVEEVVTDTDPANVTIEEEKGKRYVFADILDDLVAEFPQVQRRAVQLVVSSIIEASTKDPELKIKGCFLRFSRRSFMNYVIKFVDENLIDNISAENEFAPMAKCLILDLYNREKGLDCLNLYQREKKCKTTGNEAA